MGPVPTQIPLDHTFVPVFDRPVFTTLTSPGGRWHEASSDSAFVFTLLGYGAFSCALVHMYLTIGAIPEKEPDSGSDTIERRGP
jgi:hypothetical protein